MDYDDYRALPLWRPMTLRQLQIIEMMGAVDNPSLQQLAVITTLPSWLVVALWRRSLLWCIVSVITTLCMTKRRAQRLADWFAQSAFLPARFVACDTTGEPRTTTQRTACDYATRLSTRIIARLASCGMWTGNMDMSIVHAGELMVAHDEVHGARYLSADALQRAQEVTRGNR